MKLAKVIEHLNTLYYAVDDHLNMTESREDASDYRKDLAALSEAIDILTKLKELAK